MKNKADKRIIGMVHVGALPGTPLCQKSIAEIILRAIEEAELLAKTGFDAVMLENMHDVPYMNRTVGSEITASLTAIACSIKKTVTLPVGIQVLAGANKAALAIALAADLEFIRAEGYIYAQISDEGIFSSDAGELMRYRRQIGAEHIKVYCDIKKKHASHFITSDISIPEMAKAAEFFIADGVIITGKSTGIAASPVEIKEVKDAVACPVFIGSGITFENLEEYWDHGDGFIVGSYLKEEGIWSNRLSVERCKKIIEKAERLRNMERIND